jgi:cation transport ATPase
MITTGKVAHVRELGHRPMTEKGDSSMLMQAINWEQSYLFLAVKEGSKEVVNALLEAGGRELVMLTTDNGASCLMVCA